MTPPLAQQLAELRTALEPFSELDGPEGTEDYDDNKQVVVTIGRHTDYTLRLGDLRQARAALANTAPPPAADERTLSSAEVRIFAALHHLQADGSIDRGMVAEALNSAATELSALYRATPATRRDDGAGGVG